MLSWLEAGTGQLLTQKPQIVLALQLYEYMMETLSSPNKDFLKINLWISN